MTIGNLLTGVGIIRTGVSGLTATDYFEELKNDPDRKAFATDPKYRTREAAVENYVDHIRNMKWPDDLVEVLELEATFAPADDAEEVYLHMLQEGPVVLEDMQYSVEDVRNWNKVQGWLVEAAEVSGATAEALREATTGAIIQGAVIESAQDARTIGETAGQITTDLASGARSAAETASRNPWPVVIGIGLTGLILRRAKII